MFYIGIDPGKSGGIAVLDENLAEAWDMPDGAVEIARLIRERVFVVEERTMAALELVHAMPGQGVSSTFKFGEGFGILQGVLAAYHIPFVFVTPQKWQKAILDSHKGDGTKALSLDLARRLFPEVDLHRKRDHGKSDALLIALWLKRQQENGQ